MNSFNEFYSNIFQGNTERYILLKEITPDGKKITTMPQGLINFENHLDPTCKPCGLSPCNIQMKEKPFVVGLA